MKQVDCPRFEMGCSSPLCPLDENSINDGIWYPGEEICRRRDAPDWVKRQRAIVKAKAPSDKYFNIAMLRVLKQVRKGIGGVSPDQPLEQAEEAERKWIAEKKGGRVIAEQNQKASRVVAKKKDNLALATSTSHQEIGGEK